MLLFEKLLFLLLLSGSEIAAVHISVRTPSSECVCVCVLMCSRLINLLCHPYLIAVWFSMLQPPNTASLELWFRQGVTMHHQRARKRIPIHPHTGSDTEAHVMVNTPAHSTETHDSFLKQPAVAWYVGCFLDCENFQFRYNDASQHLVVWPISVARPDLWGL